MKQPEKQDTTFNSAPFEGNIVHTRYGKPSHQFAYQIFMMLMDVSELERLETLHPLWSFVGKKNLFYLRRRDYLGQSEEPLLEVAKNMLKAQGHSALAEKICGLKMLTHLRCWGYCYNPVTFYWVYTQETQENQEEKRAEALEGVESDANIPKKDGDSKTPPLPAAIIVDINNTPWNERYQYVLCPEAPNLEASCLRFVLPKVFHISPFYPMSLSYEWAFELSEDRIAISMKSFEAETLCFRADLSLRRLPMQAPTMSRLLRQYPCVTAKTMVAIYWQALRLWLKGSTFYPHPTIPNEHSRH